MTELLAPAGNMEALKAAISSGCDAVYLGMQKFGARAYSSNFDTEALTEAVNYAHLRGVKVYVTMNTIVFENELEDMKSQLEFINSIGVDGVIIQDLAVFNQLVRNFEDMEAHTSTQMGIDDYEGTMLLKELGAKRVVLARELDIDTVKQIKRNADIPIEIFVHGALCVSYSGNCLMSGLIGYRSGNRGRCVGSCRKLYELLDRETGEVIDKSYILSTKDLNTIEHIEDLVTVDSLKIEGRMKEPAYVSNVVSEYRKAIDGAVPEVQRLSKTFNRTYTKGYLFGEDKRDITNTQRPNNFGYEIGKISRISGGKYEITLKDVLNQNDVIRIDHGGEDVNLSVVKLYDNRDLLINSADKKCYIKIKEKLSIGDIVYKTKDYYYYKDLESDPDKEFRRFDLDFRVYAYPESKLVIDASGLGVNYTYEGDEILSVARNNPTTREQVVKQLGRLNDTIFKLGMVDYEECNAFLPAKMLNAARRDIVDNIYKLKLESQPRRMKPAPEVNTFTFPRKEPYLTASVLNQQQYDACIEAGIEDVYIEGKNVIRRNQNEYKDVAGELLIGGYGGIRRYRDSNEFVTDYSFNVVNSESVRQLHEWGAKRVTLSYELNKSQIKDLIEGYEAANGGRPSLEMIVYGRAPLMFTKYCPLKPQGLCGQCKKRQFELRDEYGSFPIVSHWDCNATILNGKVLNLLDEMSSINGIEAFRLNFTLESPSEVASVIADAKAKLSGSDKLLFNKDTDTRGHYNKEII